MVTSPLPARDPTPRIPLEPPDITNEVPQTEMEEDNPKELLQGNPDGKKP